MKKGLFNKKIWISFALLVLLLLIALGFIISLFSPVSNYEVDKHSFVIPKGQAISVIAQRLEEDGLIKSKYIFRLVVKRNNLENKIQAGTFQLSPSMTVDDLANTLTIGTADIWVTLLEGWRSEEMANELAKETDLIEFDKQEFLQLVKASEGMLYPDTYLVPRTITAQALYHLLLDTFEEKVMVGLADEIAKFEEKSELKFSDALVMASLVEREAKTVTQKKQVAGILWNRIELGMPLQVDATLQYASGYDSVQQKWWEVPSVKDRQVQSSFNTYLNAGLPPRPICNPGLEAIKASLNPATTNALFYIHSNDGSMYYATTLKEHNNNVNKYLR